MAIDDASFVELMVRYVSGAPPLRRPHPSFEALTGQGVDGSWRVAYRCEDNGYLRFWRTDPWFHLGLAMPAPPSVVTDRIAIAAPRCRATASTIASTTVTPAATTAATGSPRRVQCRGRALLRDGTAPLGARLSGSQAPGEPGPAP